MALITAAVIICTMRMYFKNTLLFFQILFLIKYLQSLRSVCEKILFEKHFRGGSKRRSIALRPIVVATIAKADL